MKLLPRLLGYLQNRFIPAAERGSVGTGIWTYRARTTAFRLARQQFPRSPLLDVDAAKAC